MHLNLQVSDRDLIPQRESWSWRSIKPQKQSGRRLLAVFLCKNSKSEKVSWGNQEPIWPISTAALKATPTARIQYLAQHKRDFSAREDPRRQARHLQTSRQSLLMTVWKTIERKDCL
ncbi:testicular haploid expressed gene protein-like [Xiphophorus maculatus]|uniref:testicular haploid expressed gene protein-like n=1 Tax=Xiphophorus maculatus TaxID=8083 RepID=UPI000C6CA50A|nr:testicular haploid expressed gene protein-like [Xiphophorus maculatus]